MSGSKLLSFNFLIVHRSFFNSKLYSSDLLLPTACFKAFSNKCDDDVLPPASAAAVAAVMRCSATISARRLQLGRSNQSVKFCHRPAGVCCSRLIEFCVV